MKNVAVIHISMVPLLAANSYFPLVFPYRLLWEQNHFVRTNEDKQCDIPHLQIQ
jgi:hypothetical protein